MATRSTIGMVLGDGSIKAIYCHWDGYPAYNGKLLDKHYTSRRKIHKLLAMGDMSSLKKNIGYKHDFGYFSNTFQACTFYGRDRGDMNCQAMRFNSIRSWQGYYLRSGCEYFYLFDKGVWTCYDSNGYIVASRNVC